MKFLCKQKQEGEKIIAFILKLPSNQGEKGNVMSSLTFHLLVGKNRTILQKRQIFPEVEL